jgi:hypothetical protein
MPGDLDGPFRKIDKLTPHSFILGYNCGSIDLQEPVICWCCDTHLPRANMAPSKRFKHQRKKKEVVVSCLDPLPEGVLFAIAESLAELEPGGVRGPSLVARDLCSLGMVSGVCAMPPASCCAVVHRCCCCHCASAAAAACFPTQLCCRCCLLSSTQLCTRLTCLRLAAMNAFTSEHCLIAPPATRCHCCFCTARRTATLTRAMAN